MQAVGTVCKPLAVFHGFHSRSEGEKGEPKSGGKPPERESHLSLFYLAAAMETVENRKWFTHRSNSLHLPSFSSPDFSLYRENVFIFVPRTYSYRDR